MPAGAAVGFVLGKIALSDHPAATDTAAPAAAAPSSDPWATDSVAGIDFGAGQAGTLNGIIPGDGGNPYGSGGLPGGGDAVLPPDPGGGYSGGPNAPGAGGSIPPVQPPPAASPSAGGATPKPAGATGIVTINGGSFFHYTGGAAGLTGHTTVSGRHTVAWAVAMAPVYKPTGTKRTVYKILNGAYAGWIVSGGGVAYRAA